MDVSVINDFGILEGTDKSSIRWDYLRHYQEVFGGWRDNEFNLIEIGVAAGASIFTWRKFFTRAQIIGIDIAESARRCTRDGIAIEIGSQADDSFLYAVSAKYPPSIVIDDGSHQADHILSSFRCLFPRLAPGGWYVIEDLNLTYGRNDVPATPHAFFSEAAQTLLDRRPNGKNDMSVTDEIDRIDFASGIVFIRKKDLNARRRQLARDVDLVWRTKNPNNYLWLSEQLAQHDFDLSEAEAAARRATDLHQGAAYWLALSRILRQRQKMDGAAESARRAIAAEPRFWETHFQLGVVLIDAGDIRHANEAFEKSIEVAPAHLRVHIEDRRKNVLEKQL